MSTYTDLHNRVKETITVDYNDRITPQEVHFLNANNEYWGTLKGHVSAVGINIDGGTLKDVILENPTLCGSIDLGDGVDLSRFKYDIKQISNDLNTVRTENNADHSVFNKKFGNHETAISALSAFAEKLDDEKIDKAATQRELSVLDKKITTVSNDLNIAITSVSCNLSSEIDTLKIQLNEENYNRISEDEKIYKEIEEKSNESIERDKALSIKIDTYKSEHNEDIEKTKKLFSEKLEHDKHYSIVDHIDGVKLTNAYPFLCKDFAVNIYNATIQDGKVKFYDPSDGNWYEIGEFSIDGSIARFKTYSNITNSKITYALISDHLYEFDISTAVIEPIQTKENGYYYVRLYKNSEDKYELSLVPNEPRFYQLFANGTAIGKIYKAKIESDRLLSGELYIATNDDLLKIFNKFSGWQFDINDPTKTSYKIESERITYEGLKDGKNTFSFYAYETIEDYIPLIDSTTSNVFGKISEKFNNDLTEQVTVSLNTPAENITLTHDDNYKVIKSGIFGEIPYNLVISADFVDNTAKFDVVNVSELYKYNFDGVTTENAGYIVPVQYNKTLAHKEFDEISVDFTNAMDIEEFKNIYVLTKNADDIWSCSVTGTDKTLQIKFGGEELRALITSAGGTEAYIFNVKTREPEIYNTYTCHELVNTTDYISLTSYTYSSTEPQYIQTVEVGSIENTESMDHYSLSISNDETNILKICVPERTTDDISREFAIIVKPNCGSDKLVELQLTDEFGNKKNYISNRRDKLLIPTNKWTNLQVNEIQHHKFFIKDFDGNENAHDISFLSNSIYTLSTNLSTEIIALSTSLSTSVDQICANISTDLSNEIKERIDAVKDLSNQILSNDADIADIYNRIKGGINYKGVVYGQYLDSEKHITNAATISTMLLKSDIGYTEDSILSNGYMYIVKKLDGSDTWKFTIEEKEIDIGDQIVINCKSENGKTIKELTISDIDIIDNEDFDTIHEPEFIELSTSLSNEITSLSTSLSTSVDQICANISTDLSNEIEKNNIRYSYLSDEISSNDGDIQYLSSEISSNDGDIQYLSDEISSNDKDITTLNNKVEFLLSVDKESMVYKGTLPYLNNIIIDSIDQGYCYLTAFINGRKGIQLDGILKQGDFFKLSAEQKQIVDQNSNSFYLGKNDYFVINKDVEISNITIDDIDIFRNAETEVTQLSINLFNKIEADDLTLSTSLSNTVDQICANISTDLSSEITSRIEAVSNLSTSLSTSVDQICANISTDLSNEIEKNNIRYSYLSDEISSNDGDIQYLSSEISSLSVNLSTDLSSEIELRKALNTRYTNSFVSTKDIGANEHISSDRLILTDEIEHIEGSTNEHKQYYMTFEAGTLVLKPLTK